MVGRVKKYRFDAIILALGRRLRAFGDTGKRHSCAPESPHLSLLRTIRTLTDGNVALVTDRDLLIPAIHRENVRHIHVRNASRKGISGILHRLSRNHPASNRVLIADASAPFIEAKTLVSLLKALRTADLAGLEGNGGAIALRGNKFSTLLSKRHAGSPADLWEWFSALEHAKCEGVKTIRLKEYDCHELPMASSLQIHKASKDRQLNAILRLTAEGLAVKDPGQLDLRGNLSFGRGVCVDSNVIIRGNVRLGDYVTIGSNCILEDSEIMANSSIKEFTTVSGSIVATNCRIGPYARIRPGSFIGKNCQVGNFVEIKDTTMASNCKINHHSFVGNSRIGRNVVIGAGTITCNFDGAKTNSTVICDDAFIGSGVMLVAPIHVGKNAFIAAGSTVAKKVPANGLTLGRAKQVSIKGWTRTKR